MLANIDLHYVLDLWFHRKWRRGMATGDAIIVRYGDDYVAGLRYRREATRFLHDLKEWLAQFGLRLHAKKTRVLEFGRFASANRKERGDRRPSTFWAYCDKTRKGDFYVGRKPAARRTLRRL